MGLSTLIYYGPPPYINREGCALCATSDRDWGGQQPELGSSLGLHHSYGNPPYDLRVGTKWEKVNVKTIPLFITLLLTRRTHQGNLMKSFKYWHCAYINCSIFSCSHTISVSKYILFIKFIAHIAPNQSYPFLSMYINSLLKRQIILLFSTQYLHVCCWCLPTEV